MTDSFVEKLNEMVGDQFGNLGDSIGQMVEANEQYQTTMGELVDKLESSTGAQAEAADKVSEAVGKASDAISEINETVTKLSDSAESIQEASTAVGATLDRQSQVATDQQTLSEELLKGLGAQREGWAVHQTAIQETYGSMEGKFEELRDALVALIDWHDRVKGELNNQLNTWQAALTVQEGLTETMAGERAAWNEMLAQLSQTTETLGGLREGLEALALKLQTDISDLSIVRAEGDEGMQQVINTLAQTGSGMSESMEEYIDVVKALTAGLPDITTLLDGLRQSIELQQQMIAGVGEVVAGAGQVSEELKETADSQVAIRESFEAVAEAGEATREALEPTATAIKEGAEALQGAVDGLTAVQDNSVVLAGELKTSTTQLREANEEAQQNWTDITAGVARTANDLDEGMTRYSQQVNANLTTSLKGFDRELKLAVDQLGSAMHQLSRIVQEIEEAAPQRPME